MLEIKGIGVSNGIVIAPAYRLVEPDLSFEKHTITDILAEKERFNQSIELAKSELEIVRDRATEKFGSEEAAIFSAHLLVLLDPELKSAIEAKIEMGMNAEAALSEVSSMFISMFEAMDNEYMQERAADIRDVSRRLLSKLLKIDLPDLSIIDEEVVIVADDLTPSMTAQLNKQFVKAFVTNIGGRTSHSAILARTLEIPAVVGTKNATQLVEQKNMMIVDGSTGMVIVNPTNEVIDTYKHLQQ